jgi:hypothetical protein
MPDQTEDTIIKTALDRFKLVDEAESAMRADCLDDLEFSVGNQWPTTIRDARERKNKPCLTMDQMQQSVRQVSNEYRQQRPAINISPVGSDSDIDTAEVLQGTVRHVEVISDAEIAYDGAHESVVRCGMGSFRLLNDYTNDDTDQQEVFIKPIRNAFSVYWQPGVPHHDAKWAFIVTDVPTDTYKEDYSESMVATSSLQSIGNTPAQWLDKTYVRVAEYFTVEEVKGKGKRPKKQVKWRKINAFEILDGGTAGQDLPGSSIPILTAYGDDLDVNGKRYVAGLIRNAKDAQRMYNYWCSAATQAIALAPASPWVAVEGSLAGYETLWEQANSGDITVLPYKQVDVAGKPAPPPTRNQSEPPIQAMTMMIRQASMDLKAATGLYDPSLGQRKGDESGKAIERLQSQGDVATLNFSDNMAREMRRCGRLLIEWIRAVYDEPRVQRIIKPDGSTDQVIIHNGPDQAAAAQKMQTDKIKKIYDIGVGQYDVVVEVGPSYKTKRQEAVATQLDFLKLLPPQLAQNFMDLVTANMDWPQAQEFAKRAKKMLPPQLQDDDGTDPTVKLNQLQGQMQQMAQQHQMQQEVIEKQTQMIHDKQIEAQAKIHITELQEHGNLLKAKIDSDTKIAVAEIGTKAQQLNERMKALENIMADFHQNAHELGMQAQDQAHQKDMAAQQAANAQQSQASDQAHDQNMAEQQQEAQPVGAE